MMAMRNVRIQGYTFDMARTVFVELFCAPRSSLEKPMYRSTRASRTFCVVEYGELDGETGYWVEDDDTHEQGFLAEYEDTLWQYDETAFSRVARPVKGRRLRRGFLKGKAKGKGTKGNNSFGSL